MPKLRDSGGWRRRRRGSEPTPSFDPERDRHDVDVAQMT
jgi:hypothetical protein